jgi:superfamily II DNA helicase RecQ
MAQSDAALPVDELETIRNLSSNELLSKFQGLCPSKQPGLEFMTNLDASERDIVYRCCLLLSTVTRGKKTPRQFQLEATLGLLAGRDCLIHAATGSGKTLCMVLPALLDPTAVSIVISPLKRLQVLQVSCINDIIARF